MSRRHEQAAVANCPPAKISARADISRSRDSLGRRPQRCIEFKRDSLPSQRAKMQRGHASAPANAARKAVPLAALRADQMVHRK
jgi:hypothetical protein